MPVPSVSFVIGYPLNTNTNGITLASGTSFSMHADFFNAWRTTRWRPASATASTRA